MAVGVECLSRNRDVTMRVSGNYTNDAGLLTLDAGLDSH
jgi:hypothetical protein